MEARRTPKTYWLCAAYLFLALAAGALTLYLQWPRLSYTSDKIADAIALSAYFLGTIAFVARRKVATALLLSGLLVALGAIVVGVSMRGFGPNFHDPVMIVGRAITLCIMLAIILYSARLAKRGFFG